MLERNATGELGAEALATSAAAAGGADEQSSLRLMLSPALAVEHCDPSTATIYLSSTGARLRIPRALYDVMLAFDTPQTITAVAGDNTRAIRAIERLKGLGMLVDENAAAIPPPPRLVTDPPVRLFDCPAQKLSGEGAEVVIVGVPYDGGDYHAAGARHGPMALRQASLQLLYALDRRTGQPLGWYDADLRLPILRGVTIGDGGDVVVTSGEPQTETFARLSTVMAALAGGDRRLCALLGGDATISFPLIDTVQRRGPLSVVRIGDMTGDGSGSHSSFLSPSTLPGRLLALPNVNGFAQIGRSELAGDALPGFATVATAQFVGHGITSLEPHLAAGQAIHLGIDMAAIASPCNAIDRGSGFGRISYADLRPLLHDIGDRYRIVGIDIVGLNPLIRDWGATSVAAMQILVAMLHAATSRPSRSLAA